MSLEPAELARFSEQLAAAAELWADHIRRDSADRAYALIHADEHVNAWVICWSGGHDTGYHDHHASAAAITVVEGAIVEERLRLGSLPHARVHHKGATIVVPPSAIHRVLHTGTRTAVTIHAYSPPLTETGAYVVDEDGRLERYARSAEEELGASPAGALI